MSSATDIAWAAGLFEGEGSITHTAPLTLRLSLASTDEDIVLRFRDIVGCGTLGGWQGVAPRKFTHQWYVDGDDAARTLQRLMPFLGQRRYRKAREMLDKREAFKEKVTSQRPCAWCRLDFAPRFKSGQVQRYCTVRCRELARNARRDRSKEGVSA